MLKFQLTLFNFSFGLFCYSSLFAPSSSTHLNYFFDLSKLHLFTY